MKKIRIKPIDLEKAQDVKSVSKNISDVLDFQISLAEANNKLVSDLNAILPLITAPFDSTNLELEIKSVSNKVRAALDAKKEMVSNDKLNSKIKRLAKDIAETQKSFITSEELQAKLKAIQSSIPDVYDDSELLNKIKLAGAGGGYNDSSIKLELSELSSKIDATSKNIELDNLTKQLKESRAEFRSFRNQVGAQLNSMQLQIDKITEVK